MCPLFFFCGIGLFMICMGALTLRATVGFE